MKKKRDEVIAEVLAAEGRCDVAHMEFVREFDAVKATHDKFRTNTGASDFAKAITVRICEAMLVADLFPKSIDFLILLGHWARHPACPPSRVTSRLP